MASAIGTIRTVSSTSLATAMKGLVWPMQIDGKWYEAEFTGDLSHDDNLLVKIKRPTKAPVEHRLRKHV